MFHARLLLFFSDWGVEFSLLSSVDESVIFSNFRDLYTLYIMKVLAQQMP